MSRHKKTSLSEPLPKKIVGNYRKMIGDPLVLYPLIGSFLTIVVTIIYLSIMSGSLPSEVPLYYSLPWGEERLAQTLWLLIIPGSSLLFFLLNFIIVFLYYRTEPVLARMLSLSVAFISFLGACTMVRIMLLVM